MIFANGDKIITYQEDASVIKNIKAQYDKNGLRIDNPYIGEVTFTKNTVSFYYDPVVVMENENTIEPASYIISIVEPVLDSVSGGK
ncbi:MULTISPECIES: hypothetical protein [Jeotgalicoccus]|uniref:hypothetical protein n=1 Tax=Jeotgalicoccus TaxID=227979 RepID=UPI0030FD75FA